MVQEEAALRSVRLQQAPALGGLAAFAGTLPGCRAHQAEENQTASQWSSHPAVRGKGEGKFKL